LNINPQGVVVHPVDKVYSMAKKIALRAVIFKSGDWWIGQCLEHDIGAQAKALKQIADELERAIVAHIVVAVENKLEPFKSIPPAPRRYWKMFDEGLKLEMRPEPREIVVRGRKHHAPTPEVHLSELVSEPA
jgi:hypothetical protein